MENVKTMGRSEAFDYMRDLREKGDNEKILEEIKKREKQEKAILNGIYETLVKIDALENERTCAVMDRDTEELIKILNRIREEQELAIRELRRLAEMQARDKKAIKTVIENEKNEN